MSISPEVTMDLLRRYEIEERIVNINHLNCTDPLLAWLSWTSC